MRAGIHGGRTLLARDAPCLAGRRRPRRRRGSRRRGAGALPGRYGHGRAQGAHDADHRRTRTGGPRLLHGLPRLDRRFGRTLPQHHLERIPMLFELGR